MATAAFCSFLDHWSRQETVEAVAVLRAAAAESELGSLDASIALLFDAIASHVQQAPRSSEGVYIDSADAFELFVSTGGNVGMYEAMDVALHDAWYNSSGDSSRKGWSLLDVGTGGGLGLLPALSRTASTAGRELPAMLELVEPSMPMLAPAVQQIKQLLQQNSPVCRSAPLPSDRDDAAGTAKHSPTELRVHNLTLQDLMARQDLQRSRWDVCQATFSLQSLPPLERRRALAWLAKRCSRLLLVEFDVDQIVNAEAVTQQELHDPKRVEVILNAYAAGVAEYAPLGADGRRVLEGFLVPVLLGFFDPQGAATNYEQPSAAWLEDLRLCGFDVNVRTRVLFEYWWADCVLVDACSSRYDGDRIAIPKM